jgi:hypothetical protein
MKVLYSVLFLVGIALSSVTGFLWAKEGFPLSLREFMSLINPRYLGKDTHFFFMVLGIFLAVYSAIELNLKRWENK